MWVDVACGLLLMVFALLGWMRGLFSQAWSVAALVGSYLIADPVLGFFRTQTRIGPDDSLLGEWILKVATGLGVYLVLLLCGYGLEKLLVERFKVISVSNRVLGASLGATKGSLAVVVALWVMLFLVPRSVDSTGNLKGGTFQQELYASKAAALVSAYNPCNLLLLARLRPYLPAEVTGSARPASKPPKGVAASDQFMSLLNDKAFLAAYQERRFMDILKNPAFRGFVADQKLLESLEKLPR